MRLFFSSSCAGELCTALTARWISSRASAMWKTICIIYSAFAVPRRVSVWLWFFFFFAASKLPPLCFLCVCCVSCVLKVVFPPVYGYSLKKLLITVTYQHFVLARRNDGIKQRRPLWSLRHDGDLTADEGSQAPHAATLTYTRLDTLSKALATAASVILTSSGNVLYTSVCAATHKHTHIGWKSYWTLFLDAFVKNPSSVFTCSVSAGTLDPHAPFCTFHWFHKQKVLCIFFFCWSGKSF